MSVINRTVIILGSAIASAAHFARVGGTLIVPGFEAFGHENEVERIYFSIGADAAESASQNMFRIDRSLIEAIETQLAEKQAMLDRGIYDDAPQWKFYGEHLRGLAKGMEAAAEAIKANPTTDVNVQVKPRGRVKPTDTNVVELTPTTDVPADTAAAAPTAEVAQVRVESKDLVALLDEHKQVAHMAAAFLGRNIAVEESTAKEIQEIKDRLDRLKGVGFSFLRAGRVLGNAAKSGAEATIGFAALGAVSGAMQGIFADSAGNILSAAKTIPGSVAGGAVGATVASAASAAAGEAVDLVAPKKGVARSVATALGKVGAWAVGALAAGSVARSADGLLGGSLESETETDTDSSVPDEVEGDESEGNADSPAEGNETSSPEYLN